MKAIVGTMNGTKTIEIEACDASFSEKELDKLTNKFNKDSRALEFVGGTTYHITYSGKHTSQRLRSSSLDELLEMYKAAWKGKTIPERKCFFHK